MAVKRIIYPPMWLVFGIVAIFVCNEYFPGLRFTGPTGHWLGGALLLAGLTLLVFAGGGLKRAGTDMVPFREVSALVTGGVYRWTRNPMYLGMTLILFATAVTVGAASALLVPPLFMLIIQWRYIIHEEALLESRFGEEYRDYRRRVRRWL